MKTAEDIRKDITKEEEELDRVFAHYLGHQDDPLATQNWIDAERRVADLYNHLALLQGQ